MVISPVLSSLRSVPVRSRPLGWADLRLYLFTALFAAGNLLVPLALHGIPNAGPVFLPLFFFTLVAAWQFGPLAGLAVALASPVLNTLLVGMPAPGMLPAVLAKSAVLAFTASLWARARGTVSLPGVAAAVLAMQTAGFLAERSAGLPLDRSWHLFAQAWPGMLLLWVGGWAVLRLLNRNRK